MWLISSTEHKWKKQDPHSFVCFLMFLDLFYYTKKWIMEHTQKKDIKTFMLHFSTKWTVNSKWRLNTKQ